MRRKTPKAPRDRPRRSSCGADGRQPRAAKYRAGESAEWRPAEQRE